jgi:FkbM family methyltransferase
MISWLVQTVALATYRNPFVNRFVQTPTGSAILVACYDLYKSGVEVPGHAALARHVHPNSCVIDVGANIGFFTEHFANWVSGTGRVIAIEPDRRHVAQLRKRLARRNLAVVDVYQAAATARSGPVYLALNPDHPGDHRLSETGERVDGLALDDLVERAGNPDIALIKIDTQGSEPMILDGAAKTLQRCKPSLFIEVDDGALQQRGTNASELIRRLDAAGYRLNRLSRSGSEIEMSPQAVVDWLRSTKEGYIDLLCVHASRSA